MNACSDPGQPVNGDTMGDDFSVGAVVNHTCNIGFVLNGASQRECLLGGNWSEPLPTCIGKILVCMNTEYVVVCRNRLWGSWNTH